MNPRQAADLGRSQPDARRGFHGGPHLSDEQLQLAGAQIGGADRLSRAAQDRIAAFGPRLFYSTFNLPFGVFVMRNTFSQVPAELEESARVDGAGTFTTLWRVMRPLVAPGIATTVLYAFLFAWTEFLAALTFLTQQGTYTFPVALLNVETGTFGTVNYGHLVAGAVIAMVPCAVLYLALQRYYVQGLMSGAVKG